MGLRELKKERTRQSIQEVAMRLFKKSGYDATSVEQIAAAAEVSPATFYRYYSDKEDVVLSMNIRPILDAAIKANSPGSFFTSFVRAVFDAVAKQHTERRDFLLTRYRLIQSVPSLKARLALQRQNYLASTYQEFAEHCGLTRDEYDLRMVFAVIGAVATDTVDYWVERQGKSEIKSLLDRAFLHIRPLLRHADRNAKADGAKRVGVKVKKTA